MKKSTKLMFQKHGWRVDRFVHNYLYFLFYYPYVKISYWLVLSLKYLTWFRPLIPVGKMAFNRYHSKVLSHADAVKIFTLDRDVRVISDENKRIVPYKYATKIIFQEPDYITVMDCPCKMSTHAPQEDINSCIAVGKNISFFWLEHCQKYNPRKITQTEAIDIINRFRKKRHITQAFFKVATGGSTGVICNCHPDTCVSLQASRFSGKISPSLSMTAKSGYSVFVNDEKCIQCGTCMDVCHFEAMKFNDAKRTYTKDICIGCELCVEKCTQGALSFFIDPEKPLPLDLDMIQKNS